MRRMCRSGIKVGEGFCSVLIAHFQAGGTNQPRIYYFMEFFSVSKSVLFRIQILLKWQFEIKSCYRHQVKVKSCFRHTRPSPVLGTRDQVLF